VDQDAKENVICVALVPLVSGSRFYWQGLNFRYEFTFREIKAQVKRRPQTTTQLAARMTPDTSKWVRHRPSTLWPGGALTLVKLIPPPSPSDQSRSVFRLSKGDDTVLIFFGFASDGKISTLRTAPDREYDW
jgi:hypothetical protein